MQFFGSAAWGIITIGFGIILLASGTEWYHYLFAVIGFVMGGHSLYRRNQMKKKLEKN